MVNLLKTALAIARMKLDSRRDDLDSWQQERLRELVAYAAKRVPYYRKISLRGNDDLASIPLTTKDALREGPDSFLAEGFSKDSLGKITTSGSSGMPVTIYYNEYEANHRLALEYYQLTECGVGPFDRQAHLTYYTLPRKTLQRLGVFRREYLSFYDDERENILRLKGIRPDVLHCYPSFLVPLAEANKEHGMGFSVKKIFSSAELLSEASRSIIEKSFQCDLRDFYGSTETSWVAWQCEKGSMHLHDSIIAEVVDDAGMPLGKGKTGNLVLTPLWKRVMPFIRYYIGDRTALADKCRCGRTGGILMPIEGRNDDFIVLPSGRIRSARFVDLSIRSIPGILLYQAVQEKQGELTLMIVPAGKLSKSSENLLVKNLKSSFPEPMEISVEIVDSIQRGKSGKIRSVISKVKP
jgi:phenylacetate-CoA ligase